MGDERATATGCLAGQLVPVAVRHGRGDQRPLVERLGDGDLAHHGAPEVSRHSEGQ